MTSHTGSKNPLHEMVQFYLNDNPRVRTYFFSKYGDLIRSSQKEFSLSEDEAVYAAFDEFYLQPYKKEISKSPLNLKASRFFNRAMAQFMAPATFVVQAIDHQIEKATPSQVERDSYALNSLIFCPNHHAALDRLFVEMVRSVQGVSNAKTLRP